VKNDVRSRVLFQYNGFHQFSRVYYIRIIMIIKDISSLSIIELKQMLARVNHDLKMNKPTMNRKARAAAKAVAPVLSELAECNIIAQRFTGNKALPPSDVA
jgi:ribosomal protein L7/L12